MFISTDIGKKVTHMKTELGKVTSQSGREVAVTLKYPSDRIRVGDTVEMRFDDGRTISSDQRRKAYATIRDIADYSGHSPEYLKEWFKFDYIAHTGEKYFSLSNCSVTTAREYINHLIDFCLRYGVPVYEESLINRTDDIDRYLYMCLLYRKCAVCGRPADAHHVTGYKIGMGGDRKTSHHLGREAIALCREHHNTAHTQEREFFEANHIYGIKLDARLCRTLGLKE